MIAFAPEQVNAGKKRSLRLTDTYQKRLRSATRQLDNLSAVRVFYRSVETIQAIMTL